MLTTFLATLNPMLTLFICMAVGFIARKTNILPENAGKVMAKLETWIFCPALSFSTMARYCTVDTLGEHMVNILFGAICIGVSIGIATLLGRLFVRKKCAERGIYMYALAFANGGYVGDPLVLALFGSEVLSYYKLFYLPFTVMIYTWGISMLVPKDKISGGLLGKLLNPPTLTMLLGIVAGLTGLGAHLPSPITSSLSSLSGCMGPTAMLIAGFTVASYDMKRMLVNKKVYVATALRLVILPAVQLALLFGIREVLNTALGLGIGNMPLYLAFFASAAPLGLNTVVFPEAYGGNPETGAGMAMISHTLCVVTIPLMYAVAIAAFGPISG